MIEKIRVTITCEKASVRVRKTHLRDRHQISLLISNRLEGITGNYCFAKKLEKNG